MWVHSVPLFKDNLSTTYAKYAVKKKKTALIYPQKINFLWTSQQLITFDPTERGGTAFIILTRKTHSGQCATASLLMSLLYILSITRLNGTTVPLTRAYCLDNELTLR